MQSALVFLTISIILGSCAAFQQQLQWRLSKTPLGHKQFAGHRALNRNDVVMSIRGGFLNPATINKARDTLLASPNSLFNGLFAGLAAITVASKVLSIKKDSGDASSKEEKPAGVKSLQSRFLIVFWLMRMAGARLSFHSFPMFAT
jgi:hypothetical protein